MINYIPARLTKPVMPKDDNVDYNDMIDQMIQDKIDFEQFENDIYEREEGISHD
jgi:hypothetical protein